MRAIRNRKIVTDPWRHELDSREQRPSRDIAPGDVIVSLERWLSDWELLLARGTKIAVRLGPEEDVGRLAECALNELWMVELAFGSFAEGRAYTQARLLRERHGFLGDIRAFGDVSRDRVAFMERCGINVFVLSDEHPLESVLDAFDEVDVQYQPAADRRPVVARLRGFRSAA